MRLPRLLALLVFGLLAATPLVSLAQTDASHYQVIVPVTDVSDAQRTQAFSTALGQVLTRVAGGQDLTGKPGYADALQNAGGIVKNFQYLRGGNPPSLTLQVTFDQGAVQRLVTQMGTS